MCHKTRTPIRHGLLEIIPNPICQLSTSGFPQNLEPHAICLDLLECEMRIEPPRSNSLTGRPAGPSVIVVIRAHWARRDHKPGGFTHSKQHHIRSSVLTHPCTLIARTNRARDAPKHNLPRPGRAIPACCDAVDGRYGSVWGRGGA